MLSKLLSCITSVKGLASGTGRGGTTPRATRSSMTSEKAKIRDKIQHDERKSKNFGEHAVLVYNNAGDAWKHEINLFYFLVVCGMQHFVHRDALPLIGNPHGKDPAHSRDGRCGISRLTFVPPPGQGGP